MEQTLALARFARTVGDALLALAADLETASAVPDTSPEEVAVPMTGQRQQQILDLPGLATEGGMKTAEVAAT